MKPLLATLTLLTALTCFGQKEKLIYTYVSFEVNTTIYDRTSSNNSGGVGFGLQGIVNSHTWVRPTVEVNADLFAGTKQMYITPDGREIVAKDEVLGIYAGPYFKPVDWMFISATLGNSIYNDKSHLGVRPSIGFFPFHHQRVEAKISFTHIYQSDDISNQGFGYLSFAVGLRII